jgi:hypothetical protein
VTAEEWTGTPRPTGSHSVKWSKTFNRNENILVFPIHYNCGFKEHYNNEHLMEKAFYQKFCI